MVGPGVAPSTNQPREGCIANERRVVKDGEEALAFVDVVGTCEGFRPTPVERSLTEG